MSKNTYIPYKKPGTKNTYTEKELLELVKCSESCEYFSRNYVRVQHPTKGSVMFEPFPYQVEMLNNFQKYQNNIAMISRQMGKTTIVAIYLLWYAMFHPDKTILVVANKREQASEIMSRIKYTYELLPDWLRDAVTEYNKQSVVFSNGSKIISRATTPDAGRGLSISCLYVDEFAFVKPNIAEEFWTAISPTLSTGGKCIITSTPKLDTDVFARIWKGATDNLNEHGEVKDVGSNGFKSTLATWQAHPDRDEKWAEIERNKTGKDRFEREHECKFIGEENALIESYTLQSLKSKEPEFKLGEVRFFSKIDENKSYIVALDPSLGVGNDYAAIQILELPSMIQVAEWASSKANPTQQVRTLISILKYIENIIGIGNTEEQLFYTYENNSYGEVITQIINDFGEENIPGNLVSEPRTYNMKNTFRKGLNTTNKSKLMGCTKLKSLLEIRKLKICSQGLINQLKEFVSSGASFSARSGAKDDLVMSMVLAIRAVDIVSRWEMIEDLDIRDTINDDDEIFGMIF